MHQRPEAQSNHVCHVSSVGRLCHARIATKQLKERSRGRPTRLKVAQYLGGLSKNKKVRKANKSRNFASVGLINIVISRHIFVKLFAQTHTFMLSMFRNIVFLSLYSPPTKSLVPIHC